MRIVLKIGLPRNQQRVLRYETVPTQEKADKELNVSDGNVLKDDCGIMITNGKIGSFQAI